MTKISVITINYNNSEGLEKTLKSVISQTYKSEIEYIVIDGGSTDGSKNILNKYNDKIDYWISEKDKGIYNAQNKGIEKATGDYCLFLNSGDCLYKEDVLSKVSDNLNEIDIVYGDIVTKNDLGQEIYQELPDALTANHFVVSTLWHPGSFIKKELFKKFGNYDEVYKIAADYEFFVRTIIKYKASTKHIAFPIAVFDLGGISSISGSFNLMVEERKKIQASLFSSAQLKEAELVEIKNLGRSSAFFKYLPNVNVVKKMYDKFYYRWYKWRTN